ncbi:MAG: thymidine kinase [Deltaproteobacteria bacterium GWA2_38_16]|nr:MAG: thymidine kinase [Deltaproteobacteria bacterium GWA2_38_16]OGQ03445.1 MAG: thymidine kinase [Deltaproteobacteria bacterium RIFCSPHIGHO2_02_FULL_38_15]OGQ33929.1 MAG: thymidine kinase [Deltaproteobacteria bacterium RIFCSPLOWO2_01_FULL_38_9]OGQ59558.1 MAG: thymidine kinase [Deltaproteobacteria bacterium RIFCSPLOWO2_12_FULL_38_8]
MMNVMKTKMGWIEVVCGSMFSGKTEELIRRLRRAQIAKLKVQVFKPTIDSRYSADHIASHNSQKLLAKAIRSAQEILNLVEKDTQVVGVDEAQFFNQDLVTVCQTLADRGIRVIVAGLDQDYRGVPFEPIPQLLAVAEYITKNNAICVVCGNPASRSQRIVAEGDRVVVGAQEAYEARCRLCFDAKLHEKIKQKEEKHAKSKTTHRQPEVRA